MLDKAYLFLPISTNHLWEVQGKQNTKEKFVLKEVYCEKVRSGINAVGEDQRQAGRAIGMTEVQVYKYVLLPNAYRIILPPLTSEFLTIFKNSSLALTIGVIELTAMTRQIEEYTFQGFEAFTAATIIYSLVTFTVMALMQQIDKRTALPGSFSKGAS